MLARLHIIISSEEEKAYQDVKDLLLQINPKLSVSPSREYAGVKDHSEFFATGNFEKAEVKPFLDQLNNDWTGEEDNCDSYGFNTKMFHQLVYYLGFTLFD